MPTIAIVDGILQILALYPSVEPAVVKAVQDMKALVSSGQPVTQAEIDALIERVKAQSAEIQSLT